MKVIKRLREHFVYSIKIGFRDPLIKKNGDTLVRYPKNSKKIGKTNFSPAVTHLLILADINWRAVAAGGAGSRQKLSSGQIAIFEEFAQPRGRDSHKTTIFL